MVLAQPINIAANCRSLRLITTRFEQGVDEAAQRRHWTLFTDAVDEDPPPDARVSVDCHQSFESRSTS